MLTTSVTASSMPSLSKGHHLYLPINGSRCHGTVRIPRPIQLRGLGLQLQPIVGRQRNQSLSIACTVATTVAVVVIVGTTSTSATAAALSATCSASGQTQTTTGEAPTITQAPVHSKKSPQLDDGDSGFPPRYDGGGEGGGRGGGDNWSGGFFFLGFLAFLAFLKDKESEERCRGSRGRRGRQGTRERLPY